MNAPAPAYLDPLDTPDPVNEALPTSAPSPVRQRRVLQPKRPKGQLLLSERLLSHIRKPPRFSACGLCLTILALMGISALSFFPVELPVLASLKGLFPGWAFRYQLLLPVAALMVGVLGGRLALIGLGLWLLLTLLGLPLIASGGGLGLLKQPGFGYWLALVPVVWMIATAMSWLFGKVTRPLPWIGVCAALGLVATVLWHGMGMAWLALANLEAGQQWLNTRIGWQSLSLWPLPYDLLLTSLAISLSRMVRAGLWPLLY